MKCFATKEHVTTKRFKTATIVQKIYARKVSINLTLNLSYRNEIHSYLVNLKTETVYIHFSKVSALTNILRLQSVVNFKDYIITNTLEASVMFNLI